MTNEETIKILESLAITNEDGEAYLIDRNIAINNAIGAVKKQIPKKPLDISKAKDGNEMEDMIELSICGSGMGHHGQCLDEFMEHAEQYMIDESRGELFNRVHYIWKKYHLNAMKAGTKWQTEMYREIKNELLLNKPELEEEFKKSDPYNIITKGAMSTMSLRENGYKPLMYDHARGDYKYGSAWLGEPLPEEILAEVYSWKDIPDYSKEELSQIRRKLIREYNRNKKANA